MVRLKKGPLDLEFAKQQIEQQLSDENVTIEIGNAQLMWPEIAGPLLIDLQNVRIIDRQKPVLAVKQVAMGLSGLNLLKGKIRPSRLIILRPEVKLYNEEGNLNAFWENREKKADTAKALPKKKLSQNVPTLAEFEAWKKLQAQIKNTPQEQTTGSKEIRDKVSKVLYNLTDPESLDYEVLSALNQIQIKDAILYGAQLNDGALAALNINLEKNNRGLEGDLTIAMPKYQDKNGFFRSDITYRRVEKDITFLGSVENIHTTQLKPFINNYPNFVAQDIFINGNLNAALNDELRLSMATLDLNIPKGKILLSDVYKNPVTLENVIVKAQLNRPAKSLKIEDISGRIGGVPLQISSEAVISKGLVTAPITVKISDVTMTEVANMVPTSEKETVIGEWLTKRLTDGVLKDVILTTNLSIQRNRETKTRDINAKNTKMMFRGEGMTVRYVDTLMPVKNAKAQGVYENDTLTITSKRGQIGDIQAKDVTVKLTDLTKKGAGMADINITASGPLKTALKYAADEPIAATKNLPFDVNKVEGNVDFNVKINFPTLANLPKERVIVLLDGTVNNLLLPNVVRNQNLTGGPYALKFGKGQVSLAGKGKLSGRDIDVSWMEYMNTKSKDYASKVTAKITADKGLRDIFGIGLEDYLSGSIPVDVTYYDRGINDTVEVKGNLAPATINIKNFGYSKPAGTSGSLSLKANLKNEELVSVEALNLDTKGLKLSEGALKFQRLSDGTTDIKSGVFGAINVNDTQLKASFDITQSNVLNIKASGTVINLKPFIQSGKNDNKAVSQVAQKIANENQPIHLSVTSPKMLAANGMALTNAKLYLELDKQGEPTHIELDAGVGKGDLNVRFQPDGSGKRNFTLDSSDAGAALLAFDLYKNMRGGKIEISSNAKAGKDVRDLEGRAIITNFSIRKAPALAKLLGAMSLPGVENLLSNDGVVFQKLTSNFEWRFRENGNILVLKEGRTSGNSLGLTFEGVSNLGDKTMDVAGTIIPLAGVNKVIGQIPIIGQILSGGDALIAASYSMKGATSNPKIAINPLSVLTPGFLRKILFEDDLNKKIKKEEKK